MNDLQELLLDLQSPAVALELVGLAACVLAAWLISWAVGPPPEGQFCLAGA